MESKMNIIEAGHKYTISDKCFIQFIKTDGSAEENFEGVISQDIIRILIDRQKYLQDKLPCDNNLKILKYLRLALIEFEKRHLDRLLEKDIDVENIPTINGIHFVRQA